MEISVHDYEGSTVQGSFINTPKKFEHLSYSELDAVEKALINNFENEKMSEETFKKSLLELDIMKAGKISNHGQLRPMHIIDKNGKHTVVWKSAEDIEKLKAGKHDHQHTSEVGEGHKVTYNGEEHTVHKVKKDGYWTLKNKDGKKHDKSPGRFDAIHPPESAKTLGDTRSPKEQREAGKLSLEQLEKKVGVFGSQDIAGYGAYQKIKQQYDDFNKKNIGVASPTLKRQHDLLFKRLRDARTPYIKNLEAKVKEIDSKKKPEAKKEAPKKKDVGHTHEMEQGVYHDEHDDGMKNDSEYKKAMKGIKVEKHPSDKSSIKFHGSEKDLKRLHAHLSGGESDDGDLKRDIKAKSYGQLHQEKSELGQAQAMLASAEKTWEKRAANKHMEKNDPKGYYRLMEQSQKDVMKFQTRVSKAEKKEEALKKSKNKNK